MGRSADSGPKQRLRDYVERLRRSDGRSSSRRRLWKPPPTAGSQHPNSLPASRVQLGAGPQGSSASRLPRTMHASGNASCVASMIRVATERPPLAARRSRYSSIAGVTSMAVTSTLTAESPGQPCSSANDQYASLGASPSWSIDRRRAASNPAARATASFAGAQAVYRSRFHMIMA